LLSPLELPIASPQLSTQLPPPSATTPITTPPLTLPASQQHTVPSTTLQLLLRLLLLTRQNMRCNSCCCCSSSSSGIRCAAHAMECKQPQREVISSQRGWLLWWLGGGRGSPYHAVCTNFPATTTTAFDPFGDDAATAAAVATYAVLLTASVLFWVWRPAPFNVGAEKTTQFALLPEARCRGYAQMI